MSPDGVTEPGSSPGYLNILFGILNPLQRGVREDVHNIQSGFPVGQVMRTIFIL